jgi:hypothetical protein
VAGERVAAGVDLDLEAGTSLADHGPSIPLRPAFRQQKKDEGMTTDKQSNQPRPLTWAFAWGWQASNLRPSDYESLALTD